MTQFVCSVCCYPSRRASCDNPGCEANPDVTAAQKERWREERDKRATQEAEWERMRRIRRRAMGWES